MHPRWKKKKFINHRGDEWTKWVIDDHLDNGRYVQVRSPQATRMGEIDTHGYRTIDSDWLSRCCAADCKHTEVLTERRTMRWPRFPGKTAT